MPLLQPELVGAALVSEAGEALAGDALTSLPCVCIFSIHRAVASLPHLSIVGSLPVRWRQKVPNCCSQQLNPEVFKRMSAFSSDRLDLCVERTFPSRLLNRFFPVGVHGEATQWVTVGSTPARVLGSSQSPI